jgi:transposase
VFTARYALSPYTKQTRFVFTGLIGKGVSQRTIAVQFGVAKSTVGNIKKQGCNTEGFGRTLQ